MNDALAIAGFCAGFVAVTLAGGAIETWLRRQDIQITHRWRMALQQIRQRAALVICLGAALFVIDWLVFDQALECGYLGTMHNNHAFALLGGLAALIGIYHWIALPRPD